jgi:hypothetical protein
MPFDSPKIVANKTRKKISSYCLERTVDWITICKQMENSTLFKEKLKWLCMMKDTFNMLTIILVKAYKKTIK